MFIWMPSCAAGPENAADWPNRMEREVTPGVCADADAATSRIARVLSRVHFMGASSWNRADPAHGRRAPAQQYYYRPPCRPSNRSGRTPQRKKAAPGLLAAIDMIGPVVLNPS